MNISSALRMIAVTALSLAASAPLAVAQQAAKADFSSETPGAESKAFLSAVFGW